MRAKLFLSDHAHISFSGSEVSEKTKKTIDHLRQENKELKAIKEKILRVKILQPEQIVHQIVCLDVNATEGQIRRILSAFSNLVSDTVQRAGEKKPVKNRETVESGF